MFIQVINKILIVMVFLISPISYLLTPTINIAIRDILYDSKIHNVQCKDLPTVEEVESILFENKEIVEIINDLTKSQGWVQLGKFDNCLDKADIIIYFCCHNQREIIEKIIGGDLFFGVPYRMINI